VNGDDPREEIKALLRGGELAELLAQAARLHGHYCPGLAFGVLAGWAALKRLGFDNTGMEELLAVVECNNCFVDGIQMTTGCALGNNALIYKDLGKTAVTVMSRKTGSAVRLALKPRQWEGEGASERDREAAELFRRVVQERDPDPEAARRMKELFREQSFETVAKGAEEVFDITDVTAAFPEYAPIVDSETCALCGEQFMGTKGAASEGARVCLGCAGADCMAVLGKGICVLKEGRFPA
jgi:formylmethanofuran dehydrogenase subunit E